MTPNPQISVFDVKALQEEDADFVLLDVREPWEYDVSHLGGISIPLGQLPDRLQEIPQDKDVVVMCRSGARSDRAVSFLRERGFTRVKNMTGGIRQWALAIDPNLVVA
jgi:adenylyltransferase/sulfurtransferase